jgi:hypothetical protein
VSVEAVERVIARALAEEGYRALLAERPYDALEGHDLEPEEQAALVAASEPDLAELGVDEVRARDFSELFRISRGGGG